MVGEAGRYFGYRDADDLAALVREVIDRPYEVDRLRALAEERVRSRYTWDAVTESYEAWFRELLERR